MSDRERWIMYPLLTFAISLSVKSQTDLWDLKKVVVVKEGRGDMARKQVSIACNQLTIESPEGRKQIELREGPSGGALVVYNTLEKPAAFVGVEKQVGAVETFDAQGRKLVMLTAAGTGGAVVAVRPEERKAMLLAHNQQSQVSGIFEVRFDEQNTFVVPRVGWVEVAGAKPKAEEKKPKNGTIEPEKENKKEPSPPAPLPSTGEGSKGT